MEHGWYAERDDQPRQTSGHDHGFSLIEVMVALFLLGICVGGLCGAASSARHASDRARDHYVAVNIAKNRMERAGAMGYEQVPYFTESSVVVDTSGLPDASGDYRRTTTFMQVKTNLREVVVSVDIRDRITTDFDGGLVQTRTYVADFTITDGGE